MAERVNTRTSTEYASDLIKNTCVPAGCEKVRFPLTNGELFRCWALRPRQVIANLTGYDCPMAIINGKSAKVKVNLPQFQNGATPG